MQGIENTGTAPHFTSNDGRNRLHGTCFYCALEEGWLLNSWVRARPGTAVMDFFLSFFGRAGVVCTCELDDARLDVPELGLSLSLPLPPPVRASL